MALKIDDPWSYPINNIVDITNFIMLMVSRCTLYAIKVEEKSWSGQKWWILALAKRIRIK
jgi:hypothetical protein